MQPRVENNYPKSFCSIRLSLAASRHRLHLRALSPRRPLFLDELLSTPWYWRANAVFRSWRFEDIDDAVECTPPYSLRRCAYCIFCLMFKKARRLCSGILRALPSPKSTDLPYRTCIITSLVRGAIQEVMNSHRWSRMEALETVTLYMLLLFR